MENSESKKRKKSYYVKCSLNKKFKGVSHLKEGIRGFFITCNKYEKETVREAYNILNEYADKLYGSQIGKQNKKPGSIEGASNEDNEDEMDIGESLEKELEMLKDVKPDEKRFAQVFTGSNNCVFIKTTLPSPSELAKAIYNDLFASKKACARYILRFLPIDGTCRADAENMQKLFTQLLQPYMENKSHTYTGIVKVRNNSSVQKTLVLQTLRAAVVSINPTCDVEYHTPDLVVHIDILRAICCVGILEDFTKFRKYNLQEVALTKITNALDEPLTVSSANNPGTDEDSLSKAVNVESSTEKLDNLDADDGSTSPVEDIGKSMSVEIIPENKVQFTECTNPSDKTDETVSTVDTDTEKQSIDNSKNKPAISEAE